MLAALLVYLNDLIRQIGSTFAHDLDYYLPLSRPVIKIHKDDLLPGTQGQFTLHDRDGQGSFNQRCADMAVAVSITPAGVMGIALIRRSQLIKQALEILHASTFVLQGRQTAGSRRGENGQQPRLDFRTSQAPPRPGW